LPISPHIRYSQSTLATVGTPLRHTPLHDLHVGLGAKMVDFGGWHMPLQYEGILAEHRRVRDAVGIFDVSHMGEIDFTGPGALAAVQRLITNDAAKLSDGKALYTCVCYPDGRHRRRLHRLPRRPRELPHRRQRRQHRQGPRTSSRAVDGRCELDQPLRRDRLDRRPGPPAVALVAQLAGEPQLADLPQLRLRAGPDRRRRRSSPPAPATPARTASSCS
jgi:aminomethyltransferase